MFQDTTTTPGVLLRVFDVTNASYPTVIFDSTAPASVQTLRDEEVAYSLLPANASDDYGAASGADAQSMAAESYEFTRPFVLGDLVRRYEMRCR